MKKLLASFALLLCIPLQSEAALQTWSSGDPLSEVRTKILANDAELYGYKVASGAVSGNTLTLTLADASTVAVNVATLVNTDAQTITNLSLNATTNVLTVALSGGNTATVDLTGLITKALTVTASGFNGNLATTDDTLQKVAQKVDDLVIPTDTDDQTAAEVPVTATGFDGNLATTDNTVQKVAQKVDDLVLGSGGATAINDLTDVDTTGKATGKVLKFDSSGNLIVGDDEIGAAGTGDITGVTAGTGLTGGGDTGAVTVGLSQATQDAIAANTAKVSFDSTSSARLANTSGTNTGDNATNTQYSGLITSKTANYVLAAPNGSAGTPSFRALVAADIPALSYQAPLTNPLVAAGSQALTADWDVGAYQIRALTFYSDVATGTAPFTVASTTAVANLNASLLEGHAASYFQTALTNPVVQANLGTNVYQFLGTPTAANFFTAVTGEGAFAATLFGYADAAAVLAGIGAQAADADLTDLADGSLTGSKVGTGINGDNVTSGTIADARIASTIARDSELPNLAAPGTIGGTTPGVVNATTIAAGAGGFAVDADGDTTVKSLNQAKTSGVAGDIGLYEANSTDTHAAGWRGPLSLTAAYRGQFANAGPTEAAIQVWGAQGSGDGAAETPYIHAVPFVNLGELFTVSGSSLVVKSGTAAPPGTCTTGAIYIDTDADTNGELYVCVATDTWKAVDDDGGAAGTPTAITVADTTDTSTHVALFTDPTGDLGPKTDGGLTYNAGTGMLTATGFTGPLTGTASGNLVSGGAAGTPSSITLTNGTGLPLSGVTDSTTEALGAGTIELGHASDTTIARSGAGAVTVEGVTITRSMYSGTATFNPTSIASGACSSAVDGGTATGVATTDVIDWGFGGDPTSTTGYAPLAAGGVYIVAYPTADHVNFKACNNTADAIDPGSVTLNWKVRR